MSELPLPDQVESVALYRQDKTIVVNGAWHLVVQRQEVFDLIWAVAWCIQHTDMGQIFGGVSTDYLKQVLENRQLQNLTITHESSLYQMWNSSVLWSEETKEYACPCEVVCFSGDSPIKVTPDDVKGGHAEAVAQNRRMRALLKKMFARRKLSANERKAARSNFDDEANTVHTIGGRLPPNALKLDEHSSIGLLSAGTNRHPSILDSSDPSAAEITKDISNYLGNSSGDARDSHAPSAKQASRRLEEDQERLFRDLQPMDFSAEIQRKIEDFSGRKWLFEMIDEWLARISEATPTLEEAVPPAFFLVGRPGAGKTMIAAMLCDSNPAVVACHFCGHSDDNAVSCIFSMAYQLSTRLPEYRDRLLALRPDEIRSKHPDAVFDELVTQPLRSIPPPGSTMLIVIDALDEATHGNQNKLADFLKGAIVQLDDTIPWLRFVITSRPERLITNKLPVRPVNLDADAYGLQNRDDICSFLQNRLTALSGGQVSEKTIQSILDRSEGLYLYATMFVQGIGHRYLSLDHPEDFPHGLREIYNGLFERRFPDSQEPEFANYEKYQRSLLELVVAGAEPLEAGLIREILGWDSYTLKACIECLGSLFSDADGRVRPFHLSIIEWLTDKKTPSQFWVDSRHGEEALTDYGWNQYETDPGKLPPYFLRYLLRHLISLERWDNVQALLIDTDIGVHFLKVVSDAGLMPDVAADFASVVPADESQGRSEELLRPIARQPATVYRQDFLRDVVLKWAERDFSAAWQFVLGILQDSRDAWARRRYLVSGFLSGIQVLSRLLSEAAEKRNLSCEKRQEGELLLIAIGLDSHLTVDWRPVAGDGTRPSRQALPIEREQRSALDAKSPNDTSLNCLFEYCANQARQGRTEIALSAMSDILGRLHGVWGILRHRKRLKPIVAEGLVRLLTTEIGNTELANGLMDEIRDLLRSLPFLGPGKGLSKRFLRPLVLRAMSVPAFAIANSRLQRQFASIPPQYRAYPGKPPPALLSTLHMTEDVSETYRRILDLYKDGAPVLDHAIDLCKKLDRIPLDKPFGGMLRATFSKILDMQAMASMNNLRRALEVAKMYADQLDSGDRPGSIAFILLWGLVCRQEGVPEDIREELLHLLTRVTQRMRSVLLPRFCDTGQFNLTMCVLQVPELHNGARGEMRNCKRFTTERIAENDWPMLARFWDQMLFAGLLSPRSIIRYFEQIFEFRANKVEIACGAEQSESDLKALKREVEKMTFRYEPGYNLDTDLKEWPKVADEGESGHELDPEPDHRTIAVLHALGTLGCLELVFPRKMDSFYQRKEVAGPYKNIIRGLADYSTVQKHRDESMLGYFVSYCQFRFPDVRERFVAAWNMVYEDAKRRNFAEPTRGDVIRLFSRIMDMVLDFIHGQQSRGA